MNKIKVFFFASIKDLVGKPREEVELPEGARLSDLIEHLSERFPGLEAALTTAIVAINQEYASGDELIPAGAEVAMFPPVAGGAKSSPPLITSISEEELDLNRLLQQITLPTSGAVCFFVGTVRGRTLHKEHGDEACHETSYLEYEAYRPMAEAKLEQIAAEIWARWPEIEGIAILQRIGRLEVGTATVAVGCSAAHRDTGVFEAARYGIDRLKQIVPVWKKEVTPQGSFWVEGEHSSHSD